MLLFQSWRLNHNVELSNFGFAPTELLNATGAEPRAAVSSFGFSGTNGHVRGPESSVFAHRSLHGSSHSWIELPELPAILVFEILIHFACWHVVQAILEVYQSTEGEPGERPRRPTASYSRRQLQPYRQWIKASATWCSRGGAFPWSCALPGNLLR